LLPLGCAAPPNPAIRFLQENHFGRFEDCCAAEREQAPSPHVCAIRWENFCSCGPGQTANAGRSGDPFRQGEKLWRGSLLPLGCAAPPKPAIRLLQENHFGRCDDCCAAEREQAPSHRCVLDDGKTVAPTGRFKRPMREDQVTHSGKASNCGEGACSRWGAQRPQNLQSDCFRRITSAGVTTAAQPSGSKLPRHRCVLDDEKAVAPAGRCKRPMREDQVTNLCQKQRSQPSAAPTGERIPE